MNHPRRILGALFAVLLGAVLLTGCGSSGSNTPSTGSNPTAPNTIVIKNFDFAPMSLTVAAGATVSVTNQDTATHTLTATGSKAFDTGDIAPGKTVTFTAPDKTGSYPYICSIHQYMTGTLVVK